MEATAIDMMESVREGSRWRYNRPTPDEVRGWFLEQPLHEGMKHEPYIGGIVVIAQTEKVKRTRVRKGDGATYIADEEEAVFTPYVKIDTRVTYFRDYVAKHEDWIATILPVPVKVIDNPTSPFFNAHLPEGFSTHAIRNGEAVTYYINCTMEVAVWERQSYADKVAGKATRPVMQARGTKQVPQVRRFPDDSCLMKAETGAVGRALGFLGMLVVGTGVATAEDVQEARGEVESTPSPQLPPVVNREGAPVSPEAPVAPAASGPAVPEEAAPEDQDEALREQALALQKEMANDHADAWAAYQEWWKGRGFGALSDLSGPALKGAVQKLERDLDAAKGGAS